MTEEPEQEKHWPRHAFNAALGWYLVMMAFHGKALGATALIQALGLSLIVGTLLTGNALGRSPLRRRQVARFYLIPFQEPTHCITDGVFRYSRNPLYLGEVIMLLGLAALLGAWQALLPIPIFATVIQLRFILPEERLLRQRFGGAYESYFRRVRRWV